MKPIILQVLLYTVFVSYDLAGQSLTLLDARQFDCDRAVTFSGSSGSTVEDYGVLVNFREEFQTPSSTIESQGGRDGLLMLFSNDELNYLGQLGSSADESWIGLELYGGDAGGYLAFTFEDSLTLDLFDDLHTITAADTGTTTAIVNAFDGEVLWSSTLYYDENSSRSVAVGNRESLLISGTFTDTLAYISPVGDTVSYSGGDQLTTYLLQISADGSVDWVYLQDGLSFVISRNITVTGDLTYFTYNDVPNTTIIALDTTGTVQEEYHIALASVYHMVLGDEGAIYLCGNYNTFSDSISDFDLSGEAPYFPPADDQSLDAFMVKYTPTMQVDWFQRITGEKIDTGVHFAVDDSGVYWTGCIQSDGVFDPDGEPVTLFSTGLEDAFIAHYSLDGIFRSVHTLVGPSSDIGTKVYVSDIGAEEMKKVRVFGQFINSIDLDPDPAEDFVFVDTYDLSEFSYFSATYLSDLSTSAVHVQPAAYEMNIFPNPASHSITIYGADAMGADYQILDGLGRVVLQGVLAQLTTVDMTDLQRGVYYLHLTAFAEYGNRKIIKI